MSNSGGGLSGGSSSSSNNNSTLSTSSNQNAYRRDGNTPDYQAIHAEELSFIEKSLARRAETGIDANERLK